MVHLLESNHLVWLCGETAMKKCLDGRYMI